MKKLIVLILCIAITVCGSTAFAAGLLPDLADTYGVEMPQLSSVTMKKPVTEESTPDGSFRMTYENINEDAFEAFSIYLADKGCNLKEYAVDGFVFTAVIEKQGRTFTFVYDDAAMTAEAIYPAGAVPEEVVYLKAGEIFIFGSYEQDNNLSNGKEPIEWLVLDVLEDKALLISKYALDCKKYNDIKTNITWEDCSLRAWLNDDFYSAAFDDVEQNRIIRAEVNADKNPKYRIDPGNATQDKIFLLSIREAEKYLTTAESRRCVPTAFAIAHGASASGSNKTADGEAACWWWLRSPGYYQYGAAGVDYVGSVGYYGHLVDDVDDCVRPALWINLES